MPAPAILAARATALASSDPSTLANQTPSQFVPILAIGIVIILTVAGLFGYRAWRGRQMAKESRLNRHERKLDDWYNGSDSASVIEKPARAALGNDHEAYAGWTPQIRTWKGIHVQGMQLPSESVVGKARLAEKEKDANGLTRQISPPPAYPVVIPEKPVQKQSLPTIVIPFTEERLSGEDKPIASPLRTVSRSPIVQAENPIADKSEDQLPLPRVMIVQNTFTPNLEDELSVVRGEAIRMLAEYKDGWCVVQRVGAYDSPKGVVPRSCLSERSQAIPALARRL